jgi:hypothetical protein
MDKKTGHRSPELSQHSDTCRFVVAESSSQPVRNQAATSVMQ